MQNFALNKIKHNTSKNNRSFHTYYRILHLIITLNLHYAPSICRSLIHISLTANHLFSIIFFFFFFNDTATTEIYTLSLHDALPFLSEEHTSELHSLTNLVCRLLL